MTTVILAEKPDQARSYMKGLGIKFKGKQRKASGETFLDPNTIVVAARGHLFELEEPEHYGDQYKDRSDLSNLPIFPDRFDYRLRDDCEDVFSEIRQAVSIADTIIIATDNDFEGSAIGYNILRFCPGAMKKKLRRVYPAALDEKAVAKMFKKLYPIDETWRQAKAAVARAKSDWLIGMNISRLVTEKCRLIGIRGNFAAGRVLTTLLSLCCNYELARRNFVEEPIYELKAKTQIAGTTIQLNSKIRCVGGDAKKQYISLLKEHGLTKPKMWGKVGLIESVPKYGWPSPPFTKGSLYAEMARVAGWKKEKTVQVMQQNYDQGYQTYPRTDSSKIDEEQYDYIYDNYENYIQAVGIETKLTKMRMPEKVLKRYLAPKGQEAAHFGIIPTEKIMTPESNVTADQRLMYEVVVRRAISLVVSPYKYVSTRIGILANDVPLATNIPYVVDKGYKEFIMPAKKSSRKRKKAANSDLKSISVDLAKAVKKGDKVPLILLNSESKTKPAPPLKSIDIFDKGGLMEKAYKYVENQKYADILKKAKGIGTSATRDKAIASLEEKKYITTDKDDYVHITANGWIMNHICENLDFSNALLTAEWEEKYDQIGKGEVKSSVLVQDTENMIVSSMKTINSNWEPKALLPLYKEQKQETEKEVSLGKCPACGGFVVKKSFFSKKRDAQVTLYGCTNDDCKFVVFKDYFGNNFTDNDIKNMLAGNNSRKLKLTSKAGNQYEAAFHLEEIADSGTWHVAMVKDPNWNLHQNNNGRPLKQRRAGKAPRKF